MKAVVPPFPGGPHHRRPFENDAPHAPLPQRSGHCQTGNAVCSATMPCPPSGTCLYGGTSCNLDTDCAQGFASPVWQNAAGSSVGTAFVAASQASKTITVGLPQAAFGTPASGWSFAVVLTGQDGFSPDQARGFTPTPQDFQFGVCATGGSSPICSADPGTMPKAMDVITPSGVSQATELDPTLGPVIIQPVPVP
jgi:hypothetical protein